MTLAEKVRAHPGSDELAATYFKLSPSAVARIRGRRTKRGRPPAERGVLTVTLPRAWDAKVRRIAEERGITHGAALVILLEGRR